MIEDCKRGNHDLVEIASTTVGIDEEKVVRWCKCCGAIVVDLDRDGRTYPGYYMRCVSPKSC